MRAMGALVGDLAVAVFLESLAVYGFGVVFSAFEGGV